MSRTRTTKQRYPGNSESVTEGEIPRTSATSDRRKHAAGDDWSTGHLAAALALGLAIGLGIGLYVGGRNSPQSTNTLASIGAPSTPVPVGAPVQSPPAGSNPQPAIGPQALLDAYGRPPSDPHYGHNHP